MNVKIDTSETNNFQVYNASAGSGKTFTLVKEYIKILLKTNDQFRFQNILAITFTNKAAAEMKVRVIDTLRAFSKDDIDDKNKSLRISIAKELNVDEHQIKTRSQRVIKNILNNYGAFNITTIDSFTYKLVRSFSFDLGLGLNFEVEMDAISLINEAVDVLISRIGDNKELTKVLIDYALSKTNEDKSWDIARDLKEIAKLLLNEDDVLQLEKIKDKPIQDFVDLQKNIKKQLKEAETALKKIGLKGLAFIENSQIFYKDFYRTQLPNYFLNLANNISKIKFAKDSSVAKNISSENFYAKSKPQGIKDTIDAIMPELIMLFRSSEVLFERYTLNKLLSSSIIPLAILQSINTVLSEIKEESNIRLNAEFNQLISKHLKEQPVAFIYEKIGEKFQHYFIDEMQDTSILQWENLIPLINNVLESESIKGEKGSLLLVGDAKQAIYRWRGGKATQFIDLADPLKPSPFFVSKKVNQLDKNWRSYSEIVDFNNRFFTFLGKHLKNKAYLNLYEVGNQQKENFNKGGYVQLSFIDNDLSIAEKREAYPEKVLKIINDLSDSFDKNEICILVRTGKQGVAIAEYLSTQNIEIISSETLLLKNNSKVNFIVNLLTLLNQPDNDEMKLEVLYYLYNHLEIKTEKHHFFETHITKQGELFYNALSNFDLYLFNTMSLYDGVEYIVRSFKLTIKSDAYIQYFLDVILSFSQKKIEGLSSFLTYWDEKKDKLSIVVPEGKDAVRIMTIHKAKGLEFPVVIYPYDLDIYKQQSTKVWYTALVPEKYSNFDTILINYNNSLKNTTIEGESLYYLQREELELDNFNLLYVALTRAKEQLYIISEQKKETKSPKYFSEFFMNFLIKDHKWNETQLHYYYGTKERSSKKELDKLHSLEQTHFTSSNWRNQNITIVPALVNNMNIDDARKYGNLIHEILANIYTVSDVAITIQRYFSNGLFDESQMIKISNTINKVVNHNELKHLFTEGLNIFNEQEIVTKDHTIVIPDRLVFHKNNVIVIDYKTGVPDLKHHHQINNYGSVLNTIGYLVTDKYLVYIDDTINVISVL